ncbi:MAG: hypothetical protein Q8P05_00800 [Candidatus Diapherotrites archaeon]|nr:hypothetical protein [Candidatus Diapherotrites archaeon]
MGSDQDKKFKILVVGEIIFFGVVYFLTQNFLIAFIALFFSFFTIGNFYLGNLDSMFPHRKYYNYKIVFDFKENVSYKKYRLKIMDAINSVPKFYENLYGNRILSSDGKEIIGIEISIFGIKPNPQTHDTKDTLFEKIYFSLNGSPTFGSTLKNIGINVEFNNKKSGWFSTSYSEFMDFNKTNKKD